MQLNKKIRSLILVGVLAITGSAVFSAFAQLLPPPPPPPPGTTSPSPSSTTLPPPPPPPPAGTSPTPIPPPAGAPSCQGVYYQQCGDASPANGGDCFKSTDCSQCYDANGVSVCETTPYLNDTCSEVCTFSGSGSSGVYQCQDSSLNPPFGACYSGGTDPLAVCIANCGGPCMQCTQVCGSGTDCTTAGTGGTNNAYQCIDGGIIAGCFTTQSDCYGSCDLINVGTCQECPSNACSQFSNCKTGGSAGEQVPGTDPNEPPATNNPLDPKIPEKPAGGFPQDPGKGNLDLSILKPGNFTDFLALLSCIFKYLLYFAIPISVVVFAIGGIMFLTSRGDPGKITTGKNILLWGIVGLIIVLLARGILAAIIGFFTGGASVAFSSCAVF